MSRREWLRLAVPLALGGLAMAIVNAAPIAAYFYGVGFGAFAALVVVAREHDARLDR